MDSKTNAVALIGVAGAGVVAGMLLRRALQKEDSAAVPPLKLPAWTFSTLWALFQAGKDNFNYGLGRLMLEGCDPSIGIATITTLGQTNVVLRDPNFVQDVITKNHQAGGGFGKSFKGSPFDGMIDRTFGRGLFFAEDQDANWGVAHKILTKPFSHRGILAMVPTMCAQADKLVAALERDTASGQSVYLYDYMVKMALETITVCSMGTELNLFDAQEAHPFPTAFQGVMDAMLNLANVPPPLWFLCPMTKSKMNKHVQVMNSIIDDIVQKRVGGETHSGGKFPDLLDLMLTQGSSNKLSDENIRSQILTFLFAGHDSTAAAMSSFFVFMVANPDVEAKVVSEIQSVVGNGDLEAHHIPKLEYLDWCMKETLRLLPPAGNYQRMAFQEDVLLGGKWKLKKWTPIIIDIFTLHMDPETWGADAALFVPERWACGSPHPYSYMPFASGPRGCIGKEFSVMEQKIIAVKLLQHFVMKTPETWAAREGSTLIKASEHLKQPIIGIDVEFSPTQFFAGASIPVQLHERAGRAIQPETQWASLGA
jgi:cytochrome P450